MLLVVGGVRVMLFVGEGDEHLMFTVGVANLGKFFLQIVVFKKGCY